MKHRVNSELCLGIPSEAILDNKWTKDVEYNCLLADCRKDAIDSFKTLAKLGFVDFGISKDEIKLGFEPSYKYEPLFVIAINLNNKEDSYIERGKAWGYYGSNIVSKKKFYRDFKKKIKFIRFVDKWFEVMKKIEEE